MKTINFFKYAVAAGVILFTACNKEVVNKEVFSGYAQKGPFVMGSSVTISELKANLDQTGKTYFTTISDNSGSFEQKNIELVSNYVELKADGYYFDEVGGFLSIAPITLYALVDVANVNSANVNVLTHLEKPRVEYLVKQGKSFAAAKKQAQNEVLAIFGFATSNTSSETLNLTKDAVLLAISSILQGNSGVVGDLMELMANISVDIKTDGVLNNMALGTKLMNNAKAISLAEIRNNLAAKYAELGTTVNIPDFESYIQSFINSNLYQQTSSITYPETGEHGANILSDAVTSVQAKFPNSSEAYSMKADVPKGMSLKIVLKGGLWGYEALPNGPVNWKISEYDGHNLRQEFTVKESGKPNDLKIRIDSWTHIIGGDPEWMEVEYITIEYYENNATTPTKTKKLYIVE